MSNSRRLRPIRTRNKLFLGVVLLGVGYFTTRALERYRSKLAFQNEVAKQRVAAIVEVSSSLADLELVLRRAALEGAAELARASEPEYRIGLRAHYDKKRLAFVQSSDAFRDQLERRRFLIGAPLHAKLLEFHNRLIELSTSAFLLQSPEEMKRIQEQLEAERLSASHLLDGRL